METLVQFVVIVFIIFAILTLLACTASSTSLGRSMLPRPVTDAVSKLAPWISIDDATATATGEFVLDVSGTKKLKTVHVRRCNDMTVAWAFDPAATCPQSGTFAFTNFGHNFGPDSVSDPKEVEDRVGQALNEALEKKQFQSAPPDEADVIIDVFGALEHEVTFDAFGDCCDRFDDHEWSTAIRTVVTHIQGDETTTVAQGSLTLTITRANSGELLWRAAAIADIVTSVDREERVRRTQNAIDNMLMKFPPA